MPKIRGANYRAKGPPPAPFLDAKHRAMQCQICRVLTRPEAHLWQKASCSRRDLGRSESFARTQEWQHYEPLFYRRALAID